MIIHSLEEKKKRAPKGWLRTLEARLDKPDDRYDANKKQQLYKKERRKAMDLMLAAFPHDSTIPLVAYAWGVNPSTIRDIQKRMEQSAGGVSVARKVCADAGKSILNSEKKRHAIYTPFFIFCKELQSSNLNTRFIEATYKMEGAE